MPDNLTQHIPNHILTPSFFRLTHRQELLLGFRSKRRQIRNYNFDFNPFQDHVKLMMAMISSWMSLENVPLFTIRVCDIGMN